MGQAVTLEDFALVAAGQPHAAANWDPVTFRKDAFDEGYTAGWEDALKQAQSDAAKAETQISDALQALDFTYFEARHHVLASLRPLIEAMMTNLLPEVAKDTLIPMAVAEIEAIAKKTDAPIEMRCTAATADKLRSALETHSSAPVNVAIEDTLTDAQIRLLWADGDWVVDTDAAQARMGEAVARFFAPDYHEVPKHA